MVVKAGSRRVRDLLQPVRLAFRHDKKVNVFLNYSWTIIPLFYFILKTSAFDVSDGRCSLCVLAGDIPEWQNRWASKHKMQQHLWVFLKILCVCVFAGYWSTEGCHTNVTQTEIVCCCNHLSFFAVLVVYGMHRQFQFQLPFWFMKLSKVSLFCCRTQFYQWKKPMPQHWATSASLDPLCLSSSQSWLLSSMPGYSKCREVVITHQSKGTRP